MGNHAQGTKECFRPALRFLQGVREVYAQALVAGEVIGPLLAFGGGHVLPGELHPQLEMRHRIRGHQQFKPEDAREQVIPHVAGPHARVSLPPELFADLVYNGVEKGSRSASRIENQNAG